MNPDEFDVDVALVERLVATQFPQWGGLSLSPVPSTGTDNAMFRLGDDLAVRLPRRPGAAPGVEREQRWLPRLAPHLPLAVPVPVGAGAPSDGFPFPWTVLRWIDGNDLADPVISSAVTLIDVAKRLGRFLAALRRIDTAGAPTTFRGGPVQMLDNDVRYEIGALGSAGRVDVVAATAVWEAARSAPPWHGPPVWIHADLYPGNLLATGTTLSAVIDWGLTGVGDPAVDLLPAWAVLDADSRKLLRDEAGLDDATWVRGRGWALGLGLGAARYYGITNPVLAGAGLRAATEAVADL